MKPVRQHRGLWLKKNHMVETGLISVWLHRDVIVWCCSGQSNVVMWTHYFPSSCCKIIKWGAVFLVFDKLSNLQACYSNWKSWIIYHESVYSSGTWNNINTNAPPRPTQDCIHLLTLSCAIATLTKMAANFHTDSTSWFSTEPVSLLLELFPQRNHCCNQATLVKFRERAWFHLNVN